MSIAFCPSTEGGLKAGAKKMLCSRTIWVFLGQIMILLALTEHSHAKWDVENISVYDFPDEDTCDYDIYLWEVLNSDTFWEDEIDYYKLFDITPNKTTPRSEIKESYLNLLSFWDSWCSLCNIRAHDTERGTRIIHQGYQTITNPKKKEAYHKEKELKKEEGSPIITFKLVKQWLKTMGVFVVLGAIIYTARKLTNQSARKLTNQSAQLKNTTNVYNKNIKGNKVGGIHTLRR